LWLELPCPTNHNANIHNLDKKSHLFILRNNQTFLSHATQETNLYVSPHPKKIHLSQSLKKTLLWKGVELPHPPLLTPKKPFCKRFFLKKTPHPHFVKLHLQLVILSI
jgi:hypothetical protein